MLPTDEPRGETIIWGESEGLADFSLTGVGTCGSHTTTGQFPASYEVRGTFYPFPLCEFEMEITEFETFSEPVVVDNTLLGALQINSLADLIIFFPKVTFKGTANALKPLPGVFVSMDSIVLAGSFVAESRSWYNLAS